MLIFTDQGYDETGRKRFYTSNIPLTVAPNEDWNLADEFENVKGRLKEEYRKQLSGQIRNKDFTCFCISDAYMHVERLVFLAAKLTVEGKDMYCPLIGVPLDGEMTMMIHGGDVSTIKEHDYYLGRLAEANGYKKMARIAKVERDGQRWMSWYEVKND